MSTKYVTQHDDGSLERTAEGEEYLAGVVTNTTGNVYSFYDSLDPTVVAAAMARLSRFGGGMRELLLKEFAGQTGQEAALLRRVLTQFGDDSVAQLGYVPVVVENASNLLTKQIEWGRLAAYLEQSTRYIYYDQKRDGQYPYFTPPQLSAELQRTYRTAMDAIFDNYSLVVRKMSEWYQAQDATPEAERDVAWRIAMRGKACDAARGLLPAATTSTVGIVGSAQAIDNLILHLLAQDLPEAVAVGREILAEVRKQHAIFFERTDLPDRGAAIVAYQQQTTRRVAALARQLDAKEVAPVAAGVTLLDYSPKDELELLTHMLYSHSNLGFAELQQQIATWSSAQQIAAFELYMGERSNRRHKPGRALEVARYTFEVVSDYGAFRDLQRHRMVDAIEWQQLGEGLGYDIPEEIHAAGLEETYRHTHELSKNLHAALLKDGLVAEAQYATLFDERLRWKLTLNARAAFHFIELRTQPAGHSNYRRIANAMYDEIAKVHPHLAKAMVFVNRDADDPSTSRLEQARRAAAKLKALGLEGLIEE
ncbi:MAG TPA: FAD-dependent thymidylate synthase [Candidatus Saccharimonadales bacterium]|nr:FAD-dependent thymidylate synthase [Candidatus Saccharimonadales bacterium]